MSSEDIRKKSQEILKKNKRKQHKDKIAKWGIISIITVIILGVGGFFVVNNINDNNAKTNEARSSENISQEQWTPELIDSHGAYKITKNGTIDTNTEPTGKTRVDIFFDLHCPYCGMFERSAGEQVINMVNNDEADVYYTPVAFLDQMSNGTRYSSRALNALITVAEKSPEHFGAYMTALYSEDFQPEEGTSYKNVSNEDLANLAKSVGVSEDVTKLIPEEHYNDWIKKQTETQVKRTDLFNANNEFSTPAIFVNVKYDGDKATGKRLQLSNDMVADFAKTVQKESSN